MQQSERPEGIPGKQSGDIPCITGSVAVAAVAVAAFRRATRLVLVAEPRNTIRMVSLRDVLPAARRTAQAACHTAVAVADVRRRRALAG